MTDKHHEQAQQTQAPQLNAEDNRREFLKKLGRYSAFASATTVTLMTVSKRSAASLGCAPDSPSGGWGCDD